MSDELGETKTPETDIKSDDTSAEAGLLSDAGKLSIQGNSPNESDQQPEIPEKPEPDVPESQDDDMISVHPTEHSETIPSKEDGQAAPPEDHNPKHAIGEKGIAELVESGSEKTEKKIFRGIDTEGKPKPPAGWSPGGPERGF